MCKIKYFLALGVCMLFSQSIAIDIFDPLKNILKKELYAAKIENTIITDNNNMLFVSLLPPFNNARTPRDLDARIAANKVGAVPNEVGMGQLGYVRNRDNSVGVVCQRNNKGNYAYTAYKKQNNYLRPIRDISDIRTVRFFYVDDKNIYALRTINGELIIVQYDSNTLNKTEVSLGDVIDLNNVFINRDYMGRPAFVTKIIGNTTIHKALRNQYNDTIKNVNSMFGSNPWWFIGEYSRGQQWIVKVKNSNEKQYIYYICNPWARKFQKIGACAI